MDENLDIYGYDDFRLFLRDLFDRRKKEDPDFSHRRFAERVEVKNPGYLLDIIKGKRSMSESLAERAAAVFGLKPAEGEFLVLLSRYGQCRKPEEREALYQEIQTRRNRSRFVRLHAGQVRYFDDTLHPLVLAAVQAFDFRGDYEALGAFLDPPVPAARLKKAVRDLCEWKLLRQEKSGRYEVEHRFLEPPATLGSLVRRMNREWILQGAEALGRIAPEDRHISTLLLSVGPETRRKIEARIEKLRREVLELVEREEEEPRQVLQLSLLCFPKSRRAK